jgi:hypothetical protein
VARFLRSLRDELKSADADRAEQLSVALSALDANNESSLPNRMGRETEQAREMLLKPVNPDTADSPNRTVASICLARQSA